MNEQKAKSTTPSRWFVAISSLAISGFAILVADLYGFVHWKVLAGPDMIATHGTPAWDRAFSILIRLERIRQSQALSHWYLQSGQCAPFSLFSA